MDIFHYYVDKHKGGVKYFPVVVTALICSTTDPLFIPTVDSLLSINVIPLDTARTEFQDSISYF